MPHRIPAAIMSHRQHAPWPVPPTPKPPPDLCGVRFWPLAVCVSRAPRPLLLQRPKHVVVAADDSPHAEAALEWVLANVLLPHDHLTIVSAAGHVSFPVSQRLALGLRAWVLGMPPMLDDT